MSLNGWLQSAVLFAVVLALMRPLGIYIARVLEGEKTFLDPVLRPIERLIYRVSGVDAAVEMNWREYAVAMLLFSFVSLLLTYVIERAAAFPAVESARPRGCRARSGMEHRGLVHHQYQLAIVCARSGDELLHRDGGAGLSQLLERGGRHRRRNRAGARHRAQAIAQPSGTSGSTATRTILWLLLPICLIASPILIQQGVPQNLKPYTVATPLEKSPTPQTIGQGPVASQEAIKMLGTNGGGFFNTNSAHPYENPTPLSNFVEMLLMFLIPASLTVTLGRITGSPGHGWAVFGTMFALLLAGFIAIYAAESRPHPLLHGVAQQTTPLQSGGNMEGKEVRFGISQSALFSAITTDESCGAVNAMHDSYTPLGRHGSAHQYHARRDRLRWSRFWPLRNADLRRALGLYCRSHGRPNPRIPWQED